MGRDRDKRKKTWDLRAQTSVDNNMYRYEMLRYASAITSKTDIDPDDCASERIQTASGSNNKCTRQKAKSPNDNASR